MVALETMDKDGRNRQVQTIEEGRAASKSPHKKFSYFISISQQAVSAVITKNSAVGNIM